MLRAQVSRVAHHDYDSWQKYRSVWLPHDEGFIASRRRKFLQVSWVRLADEGGSI